MMVSMVAAATPLDLGVVPVKVLMLPVKCVIAGRPSKCTFMPEYKFILSLKALSPMDSGPNSAILPVLVDWPTVALDTCDWTTLLVVVGSQNPGLNPSPQYHVP